MLRIAAGVLVAALLVASGWTAEKVYQKLAGKRIHVELETRELPSVDLHPGSDAATFTMSISGVGTSIPADAPPGTIEKLKARHEERKRLIAEKKYRLIDTREFTPGGPTRYVYEFTHADGETSCLNFSMRLEDVESWEDYLEKEKELIRKRNDGISKAIAAGSFRLLDVEPLSVHICREVDSSQRVQVQRIKLPDGKEIALVRSERDAVPDYETSWEDHLKSVRAGERELLDLQVTKNYTYEITLDDESTTIFSYGGGQPLKGPQD